MLMQHIMMSFDNIHRSAIQPTMKTLRVLQLHTMQNHHTLKYWNKNMTISHISKLNSSSQFLN